MPFPSASNLPDPGIKPRSLALQADSLPSEPPGKPLGKESCHKNEGICVFFGEGNYFYSFTLKGDPTSPS